MKKDNFELGFAKDLIWQTTHQKIKILNPLDFKVPGFIKQLKDDYSLDLGSLGLADSDEIKKRLEVTKLLFDQDIREKINVFQKFFVKNQYLPTSENGFLLQYKNGNSVFWDGIHELLDFLKPYEQTETIGTFVKKLEANLYFEEKEKEFAAMITKKLESIAFVEGVVTMTLDRYHDDKRAIKDFVVVGKKEYNSTWGSGYQAKIPSWMKNPVFEFTKITQGLQKIADVFATIAANRSAIIKDLPFSIIEDIREHFYYKDGIYEKLQGYRHLNFTFRFVYSQKGLSVEFINVEGCKKEVDFKFKNADFDGFTKAEKLHYRIQQRKVSAYYEKIEGIVQSREHYYPLEQSMRLFSKKFKVQSENSDKTFKWYALENLYKENLDLTHQLRAMRNFVYSHVCELQKLSNVIAHMQLVANQRGLDLCVPELVESGQGTTFKNLAPLDVFHKKIKLIPFTLPTINSRITCLTGRHGGGKSVAGKSILSSIYLAQSGLPVFAKEFKTELKTVMGSIVNDEGEGSTANTFLDKVLTLFKGIGEVPAGESIIFIDEIGKGTQETAGINIGKKILRTTKLKGYCLVFNSQIMELAEFAQLELNAKCFVVNKHHEFKEGVGDGQMDELLKEKGLDEILV